MTSDASDPYHSDAFSVTEDQIPEYLCFVQGAQWSLKRCLEGDTFWAFIRRENRLENVQQPCSNDTVLCFTLTPSWQSGINGGCLHECDKFGCSCLSHIRGMVRCHYQRILTAVRMIPLPLVRLCGLKRERLPSHHPLALVSEMMYARMSFVRGETGEPERLNCVNMRSEEHSENSWEVGVARLTSRYSITCILV